MSSHILTEVARLATRIGIMHQGRLIEEVDADALEQRRRRWLVVDARDRRAARAALSAAGFAVDDGDDGILQLCDERAITRPDEVARLLMQAGVPPTRLSVDEDDLETHFLRLVGAQQGDRV
jgi:ABC-2 type transport system ATP-binding protein